MKKLRGEADAELFGAVARLEASRNGGPTPDDVLESTAQALAPGLVSGELDWARTRDDLANEWERTDNNRWSETVRGELETEWMESTW